MSVPFGRSHQFCNNLLPVASAVVSVAVDHRISSLLLQVSPRAAAAALMIVVVHCEVCFKAPGVTLGTSIRGGVNGSKEVIFHLTFIITTESFHCIHNVVYHEVVQA